VSGGCHFISRILKRRDLSPISKRVDSLGSSYGCVMVWDFQTSYSNVFFIIERYSYLVLTVISSATLFNKEQSLFG
jgi:hypothetical protein